MTDNETVEHPSHYDHPSCITCWDICDNLIGSLSHATTYIWRCGNKDAKVKELGKVIKWVNKLIDRMEMCENITPLAIEDNYHHWIDNMGSVIKYEETPYKKMYYKALVHFVETKHFGYLDLMVDIVENEMNK